MENKLNPTITESGLDENQVGEVYERLCSFASDMGHYIPDCSMEFDIESDEYVLWAENGTTDLAHYNIITGMVY